MTKLWLRLARLLADAIDGPVPRATASSEGARRYAESVANVRRRAEWLLRKEAAR